MSLTSLTTPVLPNNWKLGWRLATSAVAADTGQASTIRRSYESKIATEARLTTHLFQRSERRHESGAVTDHAYSVDKFNSIIHAG